MPMPVFLLGCQRQKTAPVGSCTTAMRPASKTSADHGGDGAATGAVLQDERRVLAEPAEFFALKGAARKTNTKTDTKAGKLEGVAGPGGFEVLDAVAEQA